ncbi:MAG: DnaD domain protein [Clostridia bacterium]|nr:DnaD domain protein [Clostridia bacterium]MDE7328950.1 DnaD domain protein [Clostridia bacterium]
MGFCTLSKDNEQSAILLEKSFLINYLPECDELQLKVYLLGLSFCSNPNSSENSVEFICDALSVTSEDVEKAFGALADMGLVNITSYSPFAVSYKSIKGSYAKHYKKDKYADFNTQLEALFPSVAFTNINQYTVYYDFIEESKIPPETLITIARYCVNLKGEKIKANYIIAVAKNWLEEGVRTLADVDEKIKQLETTNEAMRMISKALGKKSEVDLEEKDLYLKWTGSWGFNLDAILFAAKSLKSKGGFARLDNLLDEFYRNNSLSVKEMQEYLDNKQAIYKLAYSVNKTLGLYYENVEYIVEKYINNWLGRGFDESAILLVAEYCLANSIRTLEGMNKRIAKFYSEGCVSVQAINEHLATLMQRDMAIKKIIELTGYSRNVSANDRDMFKVWTEMWNFDYEIIEYGASLCQGKPLSALNNLLAKWKSSGVLTLEQAKAAGFSSSNAPQPTAAYSKEQLSEYFYSLEELDGLED